MNEISNVDQTESPIEKKIRAFIEAACVYRPDLKDRLNVAACVQYLQLPDSIYGWVAPKPGEAAQPMPVEFKIACLMPTVINGLPPGSIKWIGNRPYACAEAFSFVANRDVRKLTGIEFRPFTEEEKEMYGIKPGDMAVVARQEVEIDNISMVLEGFGVLGLDESQPNKYGNYKVATEKTRDRMQFVRTRAIRDMWSRHISIAGLSSEDDYHHEPIQAAPAQHDPEKIVAMQNAPSLPNAEDERQRMISLGIHLARVSDRVRELGGDATALIGGEENAIIAVGILESWIDANQPTPEPPKAKRGRKAKDKKAEPLEEKPEDQALTVDQAVASEIIEDDPLGIEGPIDESEMNPANYIDETAETHLDDFDFPREEESDPIYTGTDEQKNAIRTVVRDVGLPHTTAVLSSLAGAMRGQPMSRLPAKAKALLNVVPATEVPDEKVQATPNAVAELKAIHDKIAKIGGKPMMILSENPHNIIARADASEVHAATKKLNDWYQGMLTGKK